MNNPALTLLERFFARNVDSILKSLSSGIDSLEKAVEKHGALSAKHFQKAAVAEARGEMARLEAGRAARVAKKLRAMVS
jgi:hypothetical protein